MNFSQADFEVRCEWGEKGVLQLAPISDVIVIIDVLSFSTCIDIANSRGAIVFPYQWNDGSAQAFARSINAEVAEKRGVAVTHYLQLHCFRSAKELDWCFPLLTAHR
jgi:2-phosphosulfolactate phosphatase